MLKGFWKKCQVALLRRKISWQLKRDVGGDEQIVGNVLRQIPSNEPRSKGGPDAGR